MSLLLLFNDGDQVVVPDAPSEITDRLFLAWGNLADTALHTGGNWKPSLPLANLRLRSLARPACSASLDPTATKITIDLGREEVCRCFALRGHNLYLDATARVRAGVDPTFSEVLYDSEVGPVWPSVYDTLELDWESENWFFGTYTERQRQGLIWNLVRRPPTGVAVRYIQWDLVDENNPAGFVKIGRSYMSNGWSPSRGMAFGAGLQIVDPSTVQPTYGGGEVYGRKPRYRRSAFQLNALPEAETYGQAFEMMKQAGATDEVFLAWSGADTVNAIRREMFGRLEEPSPIDHPYPDHEVVPLVLKETVN